MSAYSKAFWYQFGFVQLSRWGIVAVGMIVTQLGLASPYVFGQAQTKWKTNGDFERQLGSRIGFEWKANPVRAGIQGIAANQSIAIWLDRRVDPGFEVDLLVQDATLAEGLRRIAGSVGGGVSYVGAVAYIGSPQVAQRLATLAALRRDDVKRLPTAARSKFAASNSWTWPQLSEPKELLAQVANAVNVRVVNPDLVPHDLWAAGDWPAMPVTDHLTLLLAGFDLHFEIARDGSAIRLIAMPDEVTIERSYSPGSTLNAVADRISAALPGVTFKKLGARLVVSGTYEQHQDVARLIRGEPITPQPQTGGERLFDLRVENEPIGGIVKAVASREKLEVKADSAVLSLLKRRVSFDVKQLSLEELLKRTLAETDVAFQIRDGVLNLHLNSPE